MSGPPYASPWEAANDDERYRRERENAKRPVLSANWKDAPHIMARALASCAAHISGVCISVDPRYPEDAAVIRAACEEHGLPYHVYETPRGGIGFSNGGLRTTVMQEGEAFALKLGARYLLNLDADDTLEFDEGFRWPWVEARDKYPTYWLDEHFSGVDKYGRAYHTTYPFKRLFQVGLGWKWHGPIHEQPYCETVEIDAPAPYAEGVRYIKHIDGDRAPHVETYLRHAEICREWMVDHPDDSRYAYYIGQSLQSAGDSAGAIAAYEAYLAMPNGSHPQRYMATRALVEIAHESAMYPEAMLALFLRLVEASPDRAETWRWLARTSDFIADQLPVPVGAVLLDASAYGRRHAE